MLSTLHVLLCPIRKTHENLECSVTSSSLDGAGTCSVDLTAGEGTWPTHCWPTNLQFCSCVAVVFTVFKCFLRFRTLNASLVFLFLTKLERVGRFFLKRLLLPSNVSSISLPLNCKLHEGMGFSFPCFPLFLSLVCKIVPSTKWAGSHELPWAPQNGFESAWGSPGGLSWRVPNPLSTVVSKTVESLVIGGGLEPKWQTQV